MSSGGLKGAKSRRKLDYADMSKLALDFKVLSREYPDLLGKYVNAQGHMGFKDPVASSNLSKAILSHNFQLDIDFHVDDTESIDSSGSQAISRLIPPVPNRYIYLSWLHHLLSERFDQKAFVSLDDRREGLNDICEANSHAPSFHVLDIGTGASCIYPLIGNRAFQWKFFASELDEQSLRVASQNVERNGLSDKISLCRVDDSEKLQRIVSEACAAYSSSTLLSAPVNADNLDRFASTASSRFPETLNFLQNVIDRIPSNEAIDAFRGPLRTALFSSGNDTLRSAVINNEDSIKQGKLDEKDRDAQDYDPVLLACMTNPPFYDLDEEISPNRHSVCTGSVSEMRTVGGEIAFVGSIVTDSLILKKRVVWYSAMLGKKSSLKFFLKLLAAEKVPTVRSTPFLLGQSRTVRWGIAWSFYTFQPPLDREFGHLSGESWIPLRAETFPPHQHQDLKVPLQQHSINFPLTLSILLCTELDQDREEDRKMMRFDECTGNQAGCGKVDDPRTEGVDTILPILIHRVAQSVSSSFKPDSCYKVSECAILERELEESVIRTRNRPANNDATEKSVGKYVVCSMSLSLQTTPDVSGNVLNSPLIPSVVCLLVELSRSDGAGGSNGFAVERKVDGRAAARSQVGIKRPLEECEKITPPQNIEYSVNLTLTSNSEIRLPFSLDTVKNDILRNNRRWRRKIMEPRHDTK